MLYQTRQAPFSLTCIQSRQFGLKSFLHISRVLSSLGFALVPMVRGGSQFSQRRKEGKGEGDGILLPLRDLT